MGAKMNRQEIQDAARKLTTSLINKGFKPLFIHEYTDQKEEPLYWKLRLKHGETGEKAIVPMSHVDGQWVLKEPDFPNGKPLYKLHTLNSSNKIFYVEGESCVDALAQKGIVATTGGGATSHTKIDLEPLRNKVIYAWADNDLAGRKHIEAVARKLVELGSRVCLIDLDCLGLGSGGDVVDWLLLHPQATKFEIENLKFSEFKESKAIDLQPKKTKGKIDHLATARAVIDVIGGENIFFSLGLLWHWTGDGLWHQIDDRAIKQVIHQLTAEEQLTTSIASSVVDMVKTEAARSDIPFDNNPKVINCLNGELSYTNGGWLLEPHKREHYRTSIIPVIYDPTAQAPRFKRFLSEVFDGDEDQLEKIAVIEEAMGYSLIPSCHLEKFFMLIGSGANGKSVLLATLLEIVGKKNVSAVQPDQFDNRFQRGHLFKKLVNMVTEIKEGGEIADAQLKSLTSGELTTAENKFAPPFDYIPYATHWFGTNHLPHTRDFSDALFRRGIILTFNNKFEGQKRDVRLGETLKTELSGIFNVALEGLARLNRNLCFTECPSSNEGLNQWRMEADQAAQFVEDCCELEAGISTASGELFKAYIAWAESNGIRHKLAHKTLTQRLDRLGYKPLRKGAGGTRVISGLYLKSSCTSAAYALASGGY
jgi:P4 family phage/plasmid primase-like protien